MLFIRHSLPFKAGCMEEILGYYIGLTQSMLIRSMQMRRFTTILGLFLCLILVLGCTTGESCKKCDKGDAKKACCGTCEGKSADKCPSAETAACTGCTDLAAGKTGWCKDCGTGFFEGQEVNCKGACKGNPGGPPCSACRK